MYNDNYITPQFITNSSESAGGGGGIVFNMCMLKSDHIYKIKLSSVETWVYVCWKTSWAIQIHPYGKKTQHKGWVSASLRDSGCQRRLYRAVWAHTYRLIAAFWSSVSRKILKACAIPVVSTLNKEMESWGSYTIFLPSFLPCFPWLINKIIKSLIQCLFIWVSRRQNKYISCWNNKFEYIPISKERTSPLQW